MAPVIVDSDELNARDGDEKRARLTVHFGNFIDTPDRGGFRIRMKCAIGVCNQSGLIEFIAENCKDPLEASLEYDHTLTENDVHVICYRDASEGFNASTFYFPGFIDTHIHASQYPNCGIFGNSTLLEWLETYTFPLESSLSDPKLATVVYDAVVSHTLRHGTTCAAYFTTIDADSSKIMAEMCHSKGQRAFIGKVCMDQNSPGYYQETLEECMESSRELINYISSELKSTLIKPIITPRFAITCSSQLLSHLGLLAEQFELPIQTHLDENTDEIEFVKELFDNCKSYTDVYYQHGLLNHKTVLAHCVHLKDDEIALLEKTRAGISHCPISNSSLTSGECRVKELLERGLKVGLGSDVSGGFSVSILENARQALLVSRHKAMSVRTTAEKEQCKLSVADVLYMGTMGGAKVLNLEKRIATFDVGKEFDAQFLDLSAKTSNVSIFPWQELGNDGTELTKGDRIKTENILAKWLFNGDDRNVKHVWVKGQLCHSSD